MVSGEPLLHALQGSGSRMNFGAMLDDVILQSPTGLTANGYADVATVPAQIEMVSGGGSEALRFGSPTATGYFTVTMRHRTDLRADWRIVHAADGRVFQISSYGDPDGKRQALKVSVTTIQ